MILQKDEPIIHILVSESVSLVFTVMKRFQKQEVYGELVAKELPGTRIAHYNKVHDKYLVPGKNCKGAFDVLSSEPK